MVRFGFIRLVAALGVIASVAPAAAAERIVSLNLCTDQLLVLLADREQIASLSFLAADPNLSYVAGQIAGIPLNHGVLEEILPLEPDLVLAGAFAARPAVRLIESLGTLIVDLPLAEDFATIAEQTRLVAAAIGHEDRGEALIAEMDAILADLTTENTSDTALVYQANGFTAGSGTLADSVLAAAGFSNQAAQSGVVGYGFLPLERLIADPPTILIAADTVPGRPSLAEALLTHPAIDALESQTRYLALPSPLLACGGPYTAEAVRLLAEARSAVQ